MFIEDLRQDFYNVLLGNRVLLLVHYDVDAICTCKILQALFKCDNVSYTLVPVGGVSELKTAYEENCEEIKYVVMINCGGTIDLVDILQPQENVVFFVLDSHKPTDVCNVYSDGQIRLIYKDSEENIPSFDDLFGDDEEIYSDEEEEVEGGMQALEARVERRRKQREWEERKNALMFNYTQFSYYGKPSALVVLELAWRISRLGRAVLWAGAVAATAQRALQTRAPAQCVLDADELHRHVAGSQRQTDDDTGAKVVLEKDAWLPLYRVWSLENAIRHSPALGPHLKLHTVAGSSRVRQLLADMGFPLQQARQSYRSMDVDLRRSLLQALEASAPKHKLPVPSEASFLLMRQHAPAVAALDVVWAILGLIEHDTIPKGEGFQLALSALDVAAGDNEARTIGADAAKRALQAVASVVNATLANRMLHLAGPFNYFIVPEGTPQSPLVAGPHWLGVAARWAAEAAGARRPLVAAAASQATTLLLGVPPHTNTEPANLFGAAFEQAATKSSISVSLDHFDSSVISLPTAQRAQFLDALTALLA